MNTSLFLVQLGENSVRCGILILGVCALRFWLRRYAGASAFQWIWALVAVALLLPIELPALIQLPAPVSPMAVAEAVEPAADSRPVSAGIAPGGLYGVVEATAASNPALWLFFIWFAGFCSVTAASGLASLRLASGLRRFSRPAGDVLQQKAGELSARLAMSAPQVRETSLVNSPAVAGLFRPMILIPYGLTERLTDRECETVLLHELGHIRRLDLWGQVLFRVAVGVHWFNPLVWLAAGLARVDRELACDEFVLIHSSAEQAANYDRTLLHLVQLSRPDKQFPAMVGILEPLNHLKHRIHMIHCHRPRSLARSALAALLLLGIATAALSTSLRAANEQKPNAENSAPLVLELTYIELPAAEAEKLLGPRMNTALKESDVSELMKRLTESGVADVLSAPKVTTRPGKAAVVEVGSEVAYLAGKPEAGESEQRKTQKVGLETKLLVESLSSSNTARISVQSAQTEIRGWELVGGPQSGSVTRDLKPPAQTPAKPLLAERKVSTELAVPIDCWTVVAGGSEPAEGKALWLLLSIHKAEQDSTSQPARSEAPKK